MVPAAGGPDSTGLPAGVSHGHRVQPPSTSPVSLSCLDSASPGAHPSGLACRRAQLHAWVGVLLNTAVQVQLAQLGGHLIAKGTCPELCHTGEAGCSLAVTHREDESLIPPQTALILHQGAGLSCAGVGAEG